MIYFEQIEFCVSRRHLAIVEHSVLERDSAIHLVAGSETYAMDGVLFLGMRSYPTAILPLRLCTMHKKAAGFRSTRALLFIYGVKLGKFEVLLWPESLPQL